MKFIGKRWFAFTNFGTPDFSFGIHFCLHGRLDIHFLFWMISIGNVPMYQTRTGRIFAASNSFHDAMEAKSKKIPEVRAGNPDHGNS